MCKYYSSVYVVIDVMYIIESLLTKLLMLLIALVNAILMINAIIIESENYPIRGLMGKRKRSI